MDMDEALTVTESLSEVSLDLQSIASEWLKGRVFDQDASHFISAAFAARSVALLDAIRILTPRRWDTTGALIRVLIEASVNGVVVALGGSDEAERLDKDHVIELKKFAKQNNLDFSDPIPDGKGPRKFDQQTQRAGELLDQLYDTQNAVPFSETTYGHLYRQTSFSDIHGSGSVRPYFSTGLDVHTEPVPRDPSNVYVSLSMGIVYVALVLSAVASTLNEEIQGLEDIQTRHKEALRK